MPHEQKLARALSAAVSIEGHYATNIGNDNVEIWQIAINQLNSLNNDIIGYINTTPTYEAVGFSKIDHTVLNLIESAMQKKCRLTATWRVLFLSMGILNGAEREI